MPNLATIVLLTPYSDVLVDFGVEACPTHSSDIKTLDHPINATFMKVFNTKSADVIRDCQMAFGFRSLLEQILT